MQGVDSSRARVHLGHFLLKCLVATVIEVDRRVWGFWKTTHPADKALVHACWGCLSHVNMEPQVDTEESPKHVRDVERLLGASRHNLSSGPKGPADESEVSWVLWLSCGNPHTMTLTSTKGVLHFGRENQLGGTPRSILIRGSNSDPCCWNNLPPTSM